MIRVQCPTLKRLFHITIICKAGTLKIKFEKQFYETIRYTFMNWYLYNKKKIIAKSIVFIWKSVWFVHKLTWNPMNGFVREISWAVMYVWKPHPWRKMATWGVSWLYSVLVSVSCPKALFHLESDNIFRITVVVADWLGWNPYHRSSFLYCIWLDYLKIQTYLSLELLVCIVGMT